MDSVLKMSWGIKIGIGFRGVNRPGVEHGPKVGAGMNDTSNFCAIEPDKIARFFGSPYEVDFFVIFWAAVVSYGIF